MERRNQQSKTDDWQVGSTLSQQGKWFKSSAVPGTLPLRKAKHTRWPYITLAIHCKHTLIIWPWIMERKENGGKKNTAAEQGMLIENMSNAELDRIEKKKGVYKQH